MTSLTPADRLAAMMRIQVAALRGRTTSNGAKTSKKPVGHDRRQGNPADLASLAADRIRAIPSTDPDRRRKATRAFLECVFLAELGPDLIHDPAFVRLVDHVQQQLEADPELAQATGEAADLLLQSAGG